MDIFSCLIILTIIVFITYLYWTWPYRHFKILQIPGPTPVPVFGNLLDVGKKPMHILDQERILKYGKVVGVFEGWIPSLLVADTEMLREIFIKDFDKFVDRRIMTMRGKLGYSIFDARGSTDWKRQRSLLSRHFTTGKNKMCMPSLNRSLDSFMAMLQTKCDHKEQLEAKNLVNLFSIDAIVASAFGVELDCINNPENPLLKEAKLLFNRTTTTNIYFLIMIFAPGLGNVLDWFNVEAADVKYFVQFISQLIEKRRHSKEETQDFIQSLIKASQEERGEEKGMSDDEIIGNALLFLLAGYDTTAGTLAFLIYTLTVQQDCQQKVYEEVQQYCGTKTPTYEDIQKMEYLEMCLDENLRLYPIAARLERTCVEDTVVKGVPIKKGTLVVLPNWYFHHNPEIWDNPEEFIPERFSPGIKKERDPLYYTPFGVGPRHCIGMRLAMLEIKLAIVRILQQFRLVTNDKTQVPLQFRTNAFFLTAQDGLWFSLERR